MRRWAAVPVLAGVIWLLAAAGEAGVVATRAEGVQAAAAEEAGPGAAKVFALLAEAPYDAERALSLVEELGPEDEPEREKGDIKWPLARAFALARAGESVRAATELEKLARRLRGGVGLDVQGFRLVTRVAAFGVYEDDRRRVYHPGDRLMAYAEVIGFTCEPAPETEPERATWRVSLQVEFALDNGLTGERAAAWGPDAVEHATRSEINDLHVTRVIELPEKLAPGEYELKVEVRDTVTEGASGAGVTRLKVAGR